MVVSRKIRDVVLCVALVGLPIVVLQANFKSPEDLNVIDRAILRVSAPVQSAITAAVSAVHHGWRRYVYLVDLQSKNEKLLDENGKLKRALREAQRKLGRLSRFERLLSFRRARGFVTVGARVISRQSSPFVRVLRLRIDRGDAKLRSGLAVVTADGIVGRVRATFGGYSDVTLAVDPKSAIDVVIKRTGARGMLRGIDGTNRYRCRIDYLLRKEEVKVGDLVVTSGVAGVFPRAVPVGRISKVTKRTHGLYQEVEVTPTVDFSSLEEVLVILAPPPPPVASAPSNAQARRPARGLLP